MHKVGLIDFKIKINEMFKINWCDDAMNFVTSGFIWGE